MMSLVNISVASLTWGSERFVVVLAAVDIFTVPCPSSFFAAPGAFSWNRNDHGGGVHERSETPADSKVERVWLSDPFPRFRLCRRAEHLTSVLAGFNSFFSYSSFATANLSSHSCFWDRTCELQWVLQKMGRKTFGMTKHTFRQMRDFFFQSWCCISHVKGEFVVEHFHVALATLQFLLQLSKVVVYLIQLPWTSQI